MRDIEQIPEGESIQTRAFTALPPTEWKHVASTVNPVVRGFPVNPDNYPWIPTGYFEQKYLRLNVKSGEWITLTRIPPGEPVPWHKHHASTMLWVFEGALSFVDEGWSAGPGTLVYEPPGNTHVELSNEGCVILAWSSGPLEFLNADNTPAEVRDPLLWKQEVEEYHLNHDIPMPPPPGYFW